MEDRNLEIKVVNSKEEFKLFWEIYYEYMNRDIYPNDELGLQLTEEDLKRFFSREHKTHMHKLFSRIVDRAYPIFFLKNEEIVGFCSYCIYHSEDGKCLTIDYCILPRFRNDDLGRKFFKMIKDIELSKGAKYFELNVSNKRNMNFWLTQGFYFNGIDDYGSVILTTKKNEVFLTHVDENNWIKLISLKLSEEQLKYVANPLGILARAYVYRNYNARVFAVQKEEKIIGMLMVRDINEEPRCYELQQFLIDIEYQNQGYGYRSLKLILEYLYIERRYDIIETCVKKENTQALHLYKKIGFKDTEYIDPDVDNAYNLIFSFKDLDDKAEAMRESVM